MTIYEGGNIILIPFPFCNQSTTKNRLAVFINSNNYNENFPGIIIMAITRNRILVLVGSVFVF